MNDVNSTDLKKALREGMELMESDNQTKRDEGFSKIKQAADAGDVDSIALVGLIRRNGEKGQEKDELEAFQYLSKAAEAKHMFAMEQLAILYYDRKEYAKALPLAREAADNDAKWSRAAGIIGAMYFLGLGTEQDKLLGMSYLKRASDAGNDDASLFYAKFLAIGEGCTANPAKAAELIKGVFERTNKAYHAYELAQIYALPSLSNAVEAQAWLEKAAKLGDTDAQAELQRKAKSNSLDNLRRLSVNGMDYDFFIEYGKVVDVRVEKDTQIFSTGGYGNVPVSVNSRTTRQQVISLQGNDDVQFKLLPDVELPIHAGTMANVIYCGLASSDSGYPVGIVPKNSDKWFVALQPKSVAESLGTYEAMQPYVWLSVIALLGFVVSTWVGIGFIAFSAWFFVRAIIKNEKTISALADRVEAIAHLLRN